MIEEEENKEQTPEQCYGGEETPKPQQLAEDLTPMMLNKDNWKHRSEGMLCKTCMYYLGKVGAVKLGRCRRHAPTMQGWPVMFESDWCGDHKLDENKL